MALRYFLLFIFIFFAFGSGHAFAQGGGKAEPLRIRFAKGSSDIVLTGSLSKDQEMDYVFGAIKGQMVTVRNPKTSLFDFRIFSEENFSEGDFDSSASYTFKIPETGDYLLTVRKKRVRTPAKTRYSLTLSIK